MTSFVTYTATLSRTILYCAAMLLVLCVPSRISAQPQEVSNITAQNCRHLALVEGSSGYGKNFNWQSIAKSAALTQAEKLGASHLVWEKMSPVGAFNGTATAHAYLCQS